MNQTEKRLIDEFSIVKENLLLKLNEENWEERPEKDQDENKNIYYHPVQTKNSFFYAGYNIKKKKFEKIKYLTTSKIKKWYHFIIKFKPGTRINYINL